MIKTYTMRYTLLANHNHQVQVWGGDQQGAVQIYKPGEEPDWLRRALDVSKIAGAYATNFTPPPHALCWARLDEDYNLIDFNMNGDEDED